MSATVLANPLDDASDLKVATRDPWFDPSLSPANARAHDVVVPVIRALERHGRKRALKAKDRHTLYRVGIPVVANLIRHYLNGSPGEGIPVPRSKRDNALGGKGSRYQPFVFPRSFPKMLDTLCDLGFAEQRIGGDYSSAIKAYKRTTIRPGAKLIELIEEHKVTLADLQSGSDTEEIIILKRPKRGFWDGGGKAIPYEDNAITRRYREELRDINDWLAKADIRFDAAKCEKPVDPQARRLHRYFSNASFKSGGRLYRGFWQTLPKDVRLKAITIDGEAVIGLDYSQLNPRIAYSIAKADPPAADAYLLPGLEDRREGVKKVFNAMLFSKVDKFPKGARALFPRKVKCTDVTAAILARHPKLNAVLLSLGIGHRLMFLESEIMMGILRQCRKRNIIALPVYDCVVVKASAEVPVRRIMQQEFKVVTGLAAEVRRERYLPAD